MGNVITRLSTPGSRFGRHGSISDRRMKSSAAQAQSPPPPTTLPNTITPSSSFPAPPTAATATTATLMPASSRSSRNSSIPITDDIIMAAEAGMISGPSFSPPSSDSSSLSPSPQHEEAYAGDAHVLGDKFASSAAPPPEAAVLTRAEQAAKDPTEDQKCRLQGWDGMGEDGSRHVRIMGVHVSA